MVKGIKKSCEEMKSALKKGLTVNSITNYLDDDYINNGLLFDLLFW
jgi:hypothetical protein